MLGSTDVNLGVQCIEGELQIRRGLYHPNILPLLGVCHDFSPLPSLVSPWMKHGHVNQYLSHAQPPVTIANKLEIVGIAKSAKSESHLPSNSSSKLVVVCTIVSSYYAAFSARN
jgi:hypothetical protein